MARLVRPRRPPRVAGVYLLKITLLGIDPPIWRQLAVPSTLTLDRLHRVLQRAMGWMESHLHEFVIGGRRYGVPDPEAPVSGVLPEHRVSLHDVASDENTRFVYRYDFGDNWEHEVVIEKIQPSETGMDGAVCLAGQRHCPPEDCGGVAGYDEFLRAIRDAGHPQHVEMLEWIGGRFDPEAFSRDDVNRALRRIRGPGRAPRRPGHRGA